MRPTLNIPDPLIKEAKRRGVEEGKTLTDLLVEGLRARLAANLPTRPLPVSRARGGLVPGVDWSHMEPADATAQEYR
jgi:hypothetical protein